MLKIGIVLTISTCFAALLIAYPFSPKAAAVSAQAVAVSAQTQVLRVAQSAVEAAAVTIVRADELPVTAPRTERHRVADTTTNSRLDTPSYDRQPSTTQEWPPRSSPSEAARSNSHDRRQTASYERQPMIANDRLPEPQDRRQTASYARRPMVANDRLPEAYDRRQIASYGRQPSLPPMEQKDDACSNEPSDWSDRYQRDKSGHYRVDRNGRYRLTAQGHQYLRDCPVRHSSNSRYASRDR